VTTVTILIADDDPAILRLLTILFVDEGYSVHGVDRGYDLIRSAQELMPDLLLIDLMMPDIDGYEAVRQLRADTRTAHLPMIILTARAEPSAVVSGFESGADDYIAKPFQADELLARVRGLLRRANQRPVRSPLTGLPGNILLTEEIEYRLRRGDPFVLIYVDINNFKSFNDTYGFARGDQVIVLLAELISDEVAAAGGERDFIGHIGGDDFAIISAAERLRPIARAVRDRFDRGVRALYAPHDLARGYLAGHDRSGEPRRFPIISVAVGGVSSAFAPFPDADAVGRAAAEMKQRAKASPALFVLDGAPGM